MVSVHIEIENYCRHFIKRNTFWESIQEHNKQTRISSISTNVKQAIVSNLKKMYASKMVLVDYIRSTFMFKSENTRKVKRSLTSSLNLLQSNHLEGLFKSLKWARKKPNKQQGNKLKYRKVCMSVSWEEKNVPGIFIVETYFTIQLWKACNTIQTLNNIMRNSKK